jgi:hypothetical protein
MFIYFYFFIFIYCEFNLFDIYPKNIVESNTITIIHKTKNSIDKILCVFGVLENNNGKKIEEEMLNWLIPNYNIYIVYQKYPGKLFEYPALKFAQYLIKKTNQTLLLYIHSKGAFYPNRDNIQSVVRELWKYEFSGYNIKKYITPIINNQADVTTIFASRNQTTWFNGFYISDRAFNIIGNLDKKLIKSRHIFETLFLGTKARVLGIIENNVEKPHPVARKYFEKIKLKNNFNDL